MRIASETFTTKINLVAAYVLARGVKLARFEIMPGKYFLDSSFYFPKAVAEKLLNDRDRMVDFTGLKLEHDILFIKTSEARAKYEKQAGTARKEARKQTGQGGIQ